MKVMFCIALALLVCCTAFADQDPLAGVGQLLFTRRGVEAREQLRKAKAVFEAEGAAQKVAATTLLLGVAASIDDHREARQHLADAATQFTAVGDHFGAWLALWMLAETERSDADARAAIATWERAFALLRQAAAPGQKFSIESAELLASVFGGRTDMFGPLAAHAQMMKPILLRFAAVISYNAHAKLMLDEGELEKAEESLRHSSEDAALFGGFFDGNISRHYAELRKLQWRLDEAHELYLRSLEHARTTGVAMTPPAAGDDPWAELRVLHDLAELELLRGRLDDALSWNDRALQLTRTGKDPKREAGVLNDRAELLQKGGRYELALSTLEDVLKLATQHNDRRRQAFVHSDLGAVHMFRGSYGSAARHLETAIALFQELDMPYVEAPTWLLLAEVYTLLDAQPNADLALETARTLAERSGFGLARSMVDILTASRKVVSGQRDVATAESAINALFDLTDAKTLSMHPVIKELLLKTVGAPPALTASRGTAPEAAMPPMMAGFMAMIEGKTALERREPAKAREHLQRALELNPSRDHKAGLQGLIGAAYWMEGKTADALRALRQSAETIEATAGDVKVEELLSGYLGSDRRFYFDLLIEMLLQQGNVTEAFAKAERARARAFLQVLGNHRLNAAASADPRLVQQAENLRADIAAREQHLATASPDDEKRLLADLERARSHYRATVIRMKTTNPEYEEVMHVAPLQVDAVRAELPAGTTMLAYYVSHRGAHAWVVDASKVRHVPLQIDAAQWRQLACWTDSLGTPAARGAGVPGRDCAAADPEAHAYRLLVAPLRAHVGDSKLVIVPHGPLHYVPFAALRDPDTQRHLVEDLTITYAPSASAIRFLRAKETPVDGEPLILGNPASTLTGLEPLPGASKEASIVARILGATPLLGADASEARLHELAGKVDLVHVAAHGLYDSTNPLFSRIALAPGGNHDGSLTVGEILASLDLRGVNMVVLSACRSAVGARSGGDEIVGLTRALLYAGSPAVISTLWDIDDAAAASLMTEFYRALADGARAADALRRAQLHLLKSERYAEPRYWAAFTLTGDPQGRWAEPK